MTVLLPALILLTVLLLAGRLVWEMRPSQPCLGPGPHGSHPFLVPIDATRYAVLCGPCLARRTAGIRRQISTMVFRRARFTELLFTLHREEQPYDHESHSIQPVTTVR